MDPEIRALIIDDESQARDLIRRYVSSRPGIQIIGESATGAEAIRLIKELQPDLIFLDIQLTDINGFQLLEKIKGIRKPAVVFVTAYDEYALQAFEFDVVDYVLKPFDKERFSAALDRAFQQIRSNRKIEIIDRIYSVVSQYRPRTSETTSRVVDKRIPIRDEKGRTRFIDVQYIDWIEAAGDYVCIHVDAANYVLRRTLNDFQSSLQPDLFIRIHRSYVVNKDRITLLQEHRDRQFTVELSTSKTLPVSRTYYKNLKATLQKG